MKDIISSMKTVFANNMCILKQVPNVKHLSNSNKSNFVNRVTFTIKNHADFSRASRSSKVI